jgi:hypothetical protein
VTFTIPRRAAVTGLGVAATVFVLAIAGCGRDLGLKATKAECDSACAHAASLSQGRVDTLAEKCPGLCIERQWTVGDVRCLSDATSYEGVQGCPVTVKVVEEQRRQAQIEEQSAKIERLLAELTTAKDEAERAAIQRQLEEARAAMSKLRGVPGAGTPPISCTCEPGDTLCTTL